MSKKKNSARLLAALILSVLIVTLLASCKRTYFHIKEEINNNTSVRFTTKESYYQMGKSIALTSGSYRIVPGDSIVMFIEGKASMGSVGETGVATFEAQETARFYVMLPSLPKVGKYNVSHRAICEIIGRYNQGEGLFVCQSGQVVIDSLKRSKIYGKLTGEYLNTSNQKLSVDGNIKARSK
jgi:hypothetical protein